MLAQSDYVVAAAPLTPETRGMLGEAEFQAMKPTAVVINLGRGPVIDEAAIVRALTEKRIKGAALDVFDTEPLPDGHPFYSLENLLLSPHCADHTARLDGAGDALLPGAIRAILQWTSRSRMWWIRNRDTNKKWPQINADERG